MRFISKNANLRIVLRPGIPGSHLTGTAAIPAIYVRFQDGLANIKEEDIIEKMLNHPGFNVDYIQVDDDARDPFLNTRTGTEPAHVINQIEHGSVGKPLKSQINKPLSPELEKMIEAKAAEMAKAMVKQLAEEQIAARKPAKAKKQTKKQTVKKTPVKEPVEAPIEDGELPPIEVGA